MNLEDTPEEAAFRASVRAWLKEHAELRGAGEVPSALDHDERFARAKAFQSAKAKQRYAAITWPTEFGGYGGSEIQHLIYSQEESEFAVDSLHFFGIGIFLCVGTVLHCGTDEQRRRHIAPALAGDEVWSQLFSEPACGSDLSAVRTSAVRDGDDWVINGQKVWTTGAHYSDFGLILTRTNPDVPKHQGLTMFIVDLKAPGVEIRPIRQISGEADFNEVFFDNVRIPDSNRVGAVGGGWKVAMVTLGMERGSAGTELSFVNWPRLLKLAQETRWNGRPAIEDGRIKAQLAECWLNNFGVRLLAYRAQTALSRGGVPGPEQSILKPILAGQGQRSAYMAMDLLGVDGALTHEDLGEDWREIEHGWYWGSAFRIAGGTDEILRNIIGERVLGLPPEIRVDKDVPFSALGK